MQLLQKVCRHSVTVVASTCETNEVMLRQDPVYVHATSISKFYIINVLITTHQVTRANFACDHFIDAADVDLSFSGSSGNRR